MTVASQITDPVGAGYRITEAARSFSPGTLGRGDYGSRWVYGQAGAALAAGDVCYFSKEFVAAQLTTSASPRGALIGVPRVAVASGSWAWFQISGQCPITTAGAVAVNARLNTTATAGALDDDGTSGAKVIEGAVLAVAAAGASTGNEATLNDPYVGATL